MILALADDLTGALEVGAKFAACGLQATVTTMLDAPPQSDVLVVDAETRHLSGEEAGERMSRIAEKMKPLAPTMVYHKTDSTLRGNIGPELTAIQRAFAKERVVYVPAYPEMGRTVVGGELLVWGKRVHETEFANDVLNPITDCKVASFVGEACALILDGESNADIEAAVPVILKEMSPQVCAGPAALAGALARQLSGGGQIPLEIPKGLRCLVVNGSLHPASIEQMRFAEEKGLFDGLWSTDRKAEFDALIVFGGDTAFGMHQKLGPAPFESMGEIVTGVPVSRSGGRWWITKAGGFGKKDILFTIRDRMK